MQHPLYTEQEFKSAKLAQLLALLCPGCGKTFYRTKEHIQVSAKGNYSFFGFCSHPCRLAYKNPRIPVECKNCHKHFTKSTTQYKKHPNHFCSCSCAAKWNNTHKTKGTRVSKLELWLAQELPKLYPDLEFHFNRKDAINGELDIFIPPLRLAFELNGIFHYEPIYGPEKLANIQSNDERKFQACVEQDIELCIVDASSMKNFKTAKAQQFLKIIRNIIDIQLSKTILERATRFELATICLEGRDSTN